MKSIAIIGAGFSGTLTAIHLIRNLVEPIEIIIINEQETFNKGIAYNPYSKQHLLNVAASKMSAFSDQPDHFFQWVCNQSEYTNKDKNSLENSFLPRQLYGQYLVDIWSETIQSEQAKKANIIVINSSVIDLDVDDHNASLTLSNQEKIHVDICIMANGNQVPRNPTIRNTNFFKSTNYFQNPWTINSVTNMGSSLPILIIGNGLTMVDTVLGLLEHNFENEIFSISPNGFNLLPSPGYVVQYTKFTEEISDQTTLLQIVQLFNKHRKILKRNGSTEESLITSLRPYSQKIWQQMSFQEKKLFMNRLRHIWGVARHRIPLQVYDKIQKLLIDRKLHIYAGKIVDISEDNQKISVEFYNKKQQKNEKIIVSRVINCTGPETDFIQSEDHFLKKCMFKGIVSQDKLKLGINADTSTFQVQDSKGNLHTNLFTIGPNLRGMLWETTAVNELRQQAETVAKNILSCHLVTKSFS